MAKAMAQLTERAQLFTAHHVDAPKGMEATQEPLRQIFAPAEKAFPIGERLPPWHLLHHPGYWLRISATQAIERRFLAMRIPEDDRVSTKALTSTQISSRDAQYDTYLCPPPELEYPLEGDGGFDHSQDIVERFNEAVGHFYSHGQQRFVDKLELETGKQLMAAQRYDEAVSVLQPLWEGMLWRKESWIDLACEVTYCLHQSALRARNAKVVVATAWELQADGELY
jgi:trafficking protein particle complex subunit 11